MDWGYFFRPKKKDNPRVHIQVQNLECVFLRMEGVFRIFQEFQARGSPPLVKEHSVTYLNL
jgi:hypothetical protein